VYVSDLTARSLKWWLALRPDSFDNAIFLSDKTRECLTRNLLSKIIKRLGSRAGIEPETVVGSDGPLVIPIPTGL
jgi:hypothetical protein